MSTTYPYGVVADNLPRTGSLSWLANCVLAVGIFLGGFVMFEPAPYELLFAAVMTIWFLAGLKINRTILPLLVCIMLYSVGGYISTYQLPDLVFGLKYVTITLFLGLTSVLFAAVIAEDMGRLRLIYRAYVISAVVTSILGIIGYFGALPGFEIFTRYYRAMGAFQDPNVFGPFLALPILYLIYGLLTRSVSAAPIRLVILGILLMGIFLSFSRGAWGLMVISAIFMYLILFLNEQDARQRLKYIVLAILGVAFVSILILMALQSDAVASLFAERAKAVQSYDGARVGRFARHLIGFNWAVEKPLGIGPLEFGNIFGEQAHNIWLKSLMGYGWLGFASFLVLVLWTLIGGFKLLFRPRPWQPYYIIAYSVFVGHIVLGWVIDIDHWRHFFLLFGIIWGCFTLERRWQNYQARQGTASPAPAITA